MSLSDNKKRIYEIIELLPNDMLKEILDFATYLKEKAYREDYSQLQNKSYSFEEWVSDENDIYDEVFKNEL